MSNSILYEINLENLKDKEILEYIYQNKIDNYYLSTDFSKEFYIAQAEAGFISTSIFLNNIFYFLPEIQFEYAILDFDNLHISKKVQKLLKTKNYIFKINKNIKLFFEKINSYHKDNWLINEYEDLIFKLFKEKKENFEIFTFELYNQNNDLIAAEIGYKIKNTYTSLTGFCSRDKKYNNYGTLQLVLLALYLKEKGFSFWNLGHPYMKYKFDLGAKLYTREEFLKRWLNEV